MRIATITLLTLSASLLAACSAAPAGLAPVRPAFVRGPMAAAEAGFEDLDGQPASVGEALGHPVVLAFLSPSDGDSQAEVPLLLRLAGAYQGDGLQVIAIGEGASVEALRSFQASAQLTFPLWQDPGAAEFAARGFSALPAFQFIDARGQVQAAQQGFMSRGQLTQQIEALFGRATRTPSSATRSRA